MVKQICLTTSKNYGESFEGNGNCWRIAKVRATFRIGVCVMRYAQFTRLLLRDLLIWHAFFGTSFEGKEKFRVEISNDSVYLKSHPGLIESYGAPAESKYLMKV